VGRGSRRRLWAGGWRVVGRGGVCGRVDGGYHRGVQSLYRRPLPPEIVPFAAPAGRALFDEARRTGGMEAFFPLIEQFHTQADPAFCGLGTLVVALNALGVDPGRLWKGPWRWFSEELLDCCIPLARVRERGITLDEVACLARCNGARAEVCRPDEHGEDEFRAAVAAAAGSAVDPALIVNYDRRPLGQTGEGHYSPIGGYHRASDQVLVLDVARFKYPPHWVPVETLFRAMLPIDPASKRSRGFVTLRREHAVAPAAALRDDADKAELERFLRDLDGTDLLVLAGCIEAGISSPPPRLLEILRCPEGLPPGVMAQVERLREQLAALQDRPRPI
jgi:glutathione gamma-glutamylcysteinyltransferase